MYEQIAANKRRTVVLVAGFVLVLAAAGAAAGYLIGFGWFGVIIAFVISGGAGLRLVLEVRRRGPGGEPGPAGRPQRVQAALQPGRGLCIASGLPQPRIYIVDDEAPNAFATGRNPRHAAIAVTTGLLEKMNRVELEGVLAHELSHVKNYDILVSTIAVTLVGAVAVLSDIDVPHDVVERRAGVARQRPRQRQQPAGLPGLRLHPPRPAHRQADAGRREPQPRDAG